MVNDLTICIHYTFIFCLHGFSYTKKYETFTFNVGIRSQRKRSDTHYNFLYSNWCFGVFHRNTGMLHHVLFGT